MPVAWDPSMATGVTHVDQQHQELFRQVAALGEAMKQGRGRDEIARILDFLAQLPEPGVALLDEARRGPGRAEHDRPVQRGDEQGHEEHRHRPQRAPRDRLDGLPFASVAIVPVIVGEELVWRGVVQASLVRRLGVWGGVTMAAAVYALVHAPLGSSVLVAVAFSCGLAWGTLRATTASLVPSLVAHLLWDVLVLLWLPLDTR